MSFWITSRPPARVAVVARPGWLNFSFAVRLTPAMNADTSGRSASVEIIGGGAVQRLLGQSRLHDVEPLVQIHHQPMQAVGAALPRLHHRRDGGGIEADRLSPLRQRREQLVEPPGETVGACGEHRRRHHAHVVRDAREDPRGAGHATRASHHARAGDDAVEIGIVDAAGDALTLQRRRALLGMLGMRQRHLQQREGVFQAVIGRERRVEAHRGLQFALADRVQYLGFHLGPLFSVWRHPIGTRRT